MNWFCRELEENDDKLWDFGAPSVEIIQNDDVC
jgi:hypothetical protein